MKGNNTSSQSLGRASITELKPPWPKWYPTLECFNIINGLNDILHKIKSPSLKQIKCSRGAFCSVMFTILIIPQQTINPNSSNSSFSVQPTQSHTLSLSISLSMPLLILFYLCLRVKIPSNPYIKPFMSSVNNKNNNLKDSENFHDSSCTIAKLMASFFLLISISYIFYTLRLFDILLQFTLVTWIYNTVIVTQIELYFQV